MFEISAKTINRDELAKQMLNQQAGAFISFEGWVRNFNDNKPVTSLEYEVHKDLAVTEGELILSRAKEKFALIDAVCVHREGNLQIGDLAVWVGVTAEHRAEAFSACRYIIDEVKHKLPIWKKEHYSDGSSVWVNCQHSQDNIEGKNDENSENFSYTGPSIKFELSSNHLAKSPNKAISDSFEPIEIELEEKNLYSKQIILKDIGEAGQNKLKKSRVLVVGAGGLGSPALTYLAAAGIGTLGICESDILEISNLNRQTLYQFADLGKEKAQLAAQRIRKSNPFININVYKERLSEKNAQEIVKQYDLVLDCSDNFLTKFLLNDIAYFTGVPVIQASIYQYSGQLMLSQPPRTGQCLRCFWPAIPNDSCFASCTDAGIIGAVAGILGNMQALETIKYLLAMPTVLSEHVLYFDLTDYNVRKVRSYTNKDCPLCSKKPRDFDAYWQTQSILDQEMYVTNDPSELNILDLSLHEIKEYQLIDIREPHETKNSFLKQLLRVPCLELPLSAFSLDDINLDPKNKYLVVCQKGLRSKKLVQELRDKGIMNVYSVQGGMDAIARKFIA